jgi:hypothetical protein
MTGTRARSQASLRRALNALLLKGAPSRPGKTSADPAKSIPPDAVDIYRVQSGHISDNWHLEDNLSLMQQLGVVKP